MNAKIKRERVEKKYRFHLLGLVHLPVSERYMGCAFTQKIVKLSKMLLSLGHEVVLYGAEGSDAPCSEFVQTHTLSEIRQEWGEGDNRFEIGESAYLMNFTYGSEHPFECINGHYYDRVIPNYFDAKDFPYRAEKEDWFFFIGRLIERKGVYTAIKTVDAIGAKLVLAGQGKLPIDSPNCEVIGYVDPGKRAELMGRARAVFVPTVYLEAFGGVNVEAQLCGTPAITTNYGVFPETVVHGLTGFRCNTLQDFVDAALVAKDLHPALIRRHAERYLMDNVRWEFQAWFDDLYQLYRSATEDGVKGWHHL